MLALSFLLSALCALSRFSATSIGEWLEQLGEHALPLLEAHPKLLDQVRVEWVGRWERKES